jgi:hypothetical protein
MPSEKTGVKGGQPVWHKGRPATFLYYMGEDAAVIRFDGHAESAVVARAALSASPPDEEDKPL